MENAIKQFNTQFVWEPAVENADKLKKTDSFIVAGMGGSHLAAGLIKAAHPHVNLLVHRDYGLPHVPNHFLKESLLIASSYSGNTEEVVDALDKGLDKNLNMAVLATGGQLIEIAVEHGLPYVKIPKTGIQPRSALGFSLKGLLKIMGVEEILEETTELSKTLNPGALQDAGRELAEWLKGKVPIIYSSADNLSVVYNWKIKFNETGKIPAFYNVFPELNHNEMTGFDITGSGAISPIRKTLNTPFAFIFLKDESDHQRVQKRMEILDRQYKDRGLPVRTLLLRGARVWEKIFSSLLLADWTALYTARLYGLEAQQVPMVEEFKKLIF